MKKFLKWGVIIILVIVVLATVAGGGKEGKSNSSGSSSSSTNEIKQSPAPEKSYKVAETISSPTMEITVTSVDQKASVGGQYFKENASEGATLVVVQWKYKNISDKPINSFEQPTVKLVDSKGTEYERDLGKTSTYSTEIKLDRKFLSDLNPGITVNDASVFEISKEAYAEGGWKLNVNDGEETFVFEL